MTPYDFPDTWGVRNKRGNKKQLKDIEQLIKYNEVPPGGLERLWDTHQESYILHWAGGVYDRLRSEGYNVSYKQVLDTYIDMSGVLGSKTKLLKQMLDDEENENGKASAEYFKKLYYNR